MARTSLRIVNARQHNLKSVSVELPHRSCIVVTGPSGSGKSSLAFDTLYAEGQRRYIESLSTYAKQFLERMPKPDVDRIEGLAPAVAIEQRAPTTSSRSTVGTATEIWDFLRVLWARVGHPFCRACGARVRRDTPAEATAQIQGAMTGRFQVGFPLPTSVTGPPEAVATQLRSLGFLRILVEGRPWSLDPLPDDLSWSDPTTVLVVVDRLSPESPAARITEAVATAFTEGEGVAVAMDEMGTRLRFTEHDACSACDTRAPSRTPALFSFNHPRGACAGCNGFGAVLEYDEALIVPDPARSLQEGAIDPWTKPRYEARRQLLMRTAQALGADDKAPWESLPVPIRRELLHGRKGKYVGIFPFLRDLEAKRYKQYIRVFLRQYQMAHRCPACEGSRLNADALSVRVDGRSIAEIATLSVESLETWLQGLALAPDEMAVGRIILDEVRQRTRFLTDVGLGYLTLDRQTRTLSGGEAQRIALSNALGARLMDTLYVLDEPSIGLHPRDTDRLLALLRRLRDAGNTVVVVEHDLAAITQADFMVELGPGAGELGGEIVHAGPVQEARDTLTGLYLTGRRRIGVPSARRPAGPRWLRVRGARLHNLRGVDADIPLGTLTAVTGVSGCGKSTLVHDILYRQLQLALGGAHSAKAHLGEQVGSVDRLEGVEQLEDVLLIDQSPIGRSPRSNPITFVKGFDDIRALFASQPLSQSRKYTPSTFSFNMPGGRCPVCDGAGHVQIEMVFLADVFVPCDACRATRFRPEVLEVRINRQSIHDVLQWTVDEAISRFRHQPKLGTALWHLQQVGLGYLRLGQPATTLSGGEAQRLKIARELAVAGKRAGRKLYLLDEPTTGLHLDDVRVLLQVFDRLVNAGHTVVVIEHHLDVIKRADWVIDLGPEAGERGGEVVVQGRPEDIVLERRSHTGRWLAPLLAAGLEPARV